MSKSVHDDVLDAALNYIKNNGNRLTICSQAPTTYTEATSTYKLADVDISSSDYTGPANGDSSGRKLTVNAQSGITVDTSGTATHVAIVDTTDSKLLLVTEISNSQSLTAGNTCSTSAFDDEIADPS